VALRNVCRVLITVTRGSPASSSCIVLVKQQAACMHASICL
jgi:hypothetical protein